VQKFKLSKNCCLLSYFLQQNNITFANQVYFEMLLMIIYLNVKPVVLKVVFTFLPYKPNHCQFLPTKITNDNCTNFALPAVKKQQTIMNQTDSYSISHCSYSSLCLQVTAIATWQAHGSLYHGTCW